MVLLDNYWQSSNDRDRLELPDAILKDMQVCARDGLEYAGHEDYDWLADDAEQLGRYLI